MITSNPPAIVMRMAVPRSGCAAVSATGTRMMAASTPSDESEGGNGRSCR